MVCEDLHRKGESEKILSSSLKATDNGQQLLIENTVVVFSR